MGGLNGATDLTNCCLARGTFDVVAQHDRFRDLFHRFAPLADSFPTRTQTKHESVATTAEMTSTTIDAASCREVGSERFFKHEFFLPPRIAIL